MFDSSRFMRIIRYAPKAAVPVVIAIGFTAGTSLFGQLPAAQEIASQMTMGWNTGNSLEPPGGETSWGNPKIDQELIDAVAEAGFNVIRIPVAWDSHADPNTHQITPSWLARVQEVVDYCFENNLWVILNCHWDGGWLENNVNASSQESVNEKQESYWTQIAEWFIDYDEHLLFAGANEPNVDNAAQMTVLMTYHQTFVDAVRATGGNNASRVLVIQGPSTDIDKTVNLMSAWPADVIENRLMAEVHYYTPWQFCGMTQDETWGKMAWFWGKDYHSAAHPDRNATYGEESAVDLNFRKMKTKFVDKGIPVILGEYGVVKRLSLTGDDLALHIASREHYYRTVTGSMVRHGLVPVYWDAGYIGNNTMTLFNRNDGSVYDQAALDALMEGYTSATSVRRSRQPGRGSAPFAVTAVSQPGSAFAEIRLQSAAAGRADIMVFNVLGQIVADLGEFRISAGRNRVQWNTSGLAAGMYLIQVWTGEHAMTAKTLLVR
ncbi:cellulase family glycosylhydrolase [bacterium]|nr:cellulase family glycosylhydrolase [bacterium]